MQFVIHKSTSVYECIADKPASRTVGRSMTALCFCVAKNYCDWLPEGEKFSQRGRSWGHHTKRV